MRPNWFPTARSRLIAERCFDRILGSTIIPDLRLIPSCLPSSIRVPGQTAGEVRLRSQGVADGFNMAAYGDFELEHELIPGTPVSSVYLAKRLGGEAGQQYVVKVFNTGEDAGPAASVLGEHMLKRARQQKKLAANTELNVAPVLDFGIEKTGFWFALPHFPKGSLKSVIVNGVNEIDLRRIILKVVQGLIALQTKTGRTHGNLKYSNVFFAGDLKSGPAVTQSEIVFADLTANEECTGAEGEMADLHSIGVLIYQMVHGSAVDESAITWPNSPSPQWDALGRKANYWRQLCDWLLQPNPDLAQLNLRQLSADLQRKPQKKRKLFLRAGVAAAALLIIALVFAALGPESPEEIEEFASAESSEPRITAPMPPAGSPPVEPAKTPACNHLPVAHKQKPAEA